MAEAPSFDVLTANAVDLQQLLRRNKISSIQIVDEYLRQIERHDTKLNCFISVAPREILHRAAASLDEERRQGKVRGPMHGIPIVLKVDESSPHSADTPGLRSSGQFHHGIGSGDGHHGWFMGFGGSQGDSKLGHCTKVC